jgi:hypothetical protein
MKETILLFNLFLVLIGRPVPTEIGSSTKSRLTNLLGLSISTQPIWTDPPRRTWILGA